MKYILIIALLISYTIIVPNGFSQTKQNIDTVYFDADWKLTTKGKHEFYRPLPLKTNGQLSLLKDFYKNGNLQMQGYVYSNDITKLVGDIYWYEENGDDGAYGQYFNPFNTPLTYYHSNNNLWKSITYKNGVKEGEVKIFGLNGKYVVSDFFNNGSLKNYYNSKFFRKNYSGKNTNNKYIKQELSTLKDYTKTLYWLNTGNLAQKTTYLNNKIETEKFYNEDGGLLQEYSKQNYVNNRLLNGTLYTYNSKNGFSTVSKSINYNTQNKQVIELNNISYLELDNYGDIDFYKKNKLKNYIKLNYQLLYNKEKPEKLLRFITEDINEKSFKDIKKDSDMIIDVNDIKTQSVKSLLQTIATKQWSKTYLDSTSYKKEKHKIIFKQFNSELFTFLDLAYSKNNNRGFGSYYKDDGKEKWRIDKVNFYTINVVLLNKNKPILILSKNHTINYYIIPTNKNGLIVNFKRLGVVEKPHATLTESVLKKMNQVKNSDKYYGIKTKKGKEYITNVFNEIIIDKGYDSIQRVKQYILGKHKKYIDIYNFQLDKLPFNNIKKVYHDRGNLQILTDNTVKYIDPLGKETERVEMEYSFCGTVSYTSYEILKENRKDNLNAIEINTGHVGISFGNDVLLLKNLDTTYNLNFLNKRKTDGFNGNSRMIDGYVNRTNLLVAIKNNKVGLYSYNYKDIDFKYELESKPKKETRKKIIPKKGNEILPIKEDTFEEEIIIIEDILDEDTPLYGTTNAKELLPVVYDIIELRGKLIVVKKDGKYGFYPLREELKYKNLGNVIGNFMSYETFTGEKGWLDVNTLKEYPNE